MERFDEIELIDCPICGGTGSVEEEGGDELEFREGHPSHPRRLTRRFETESRRRQTPPAAELVKKQGF